VSTGLGLSRLSVPRSRTRHQMARQDMATRDEWEHYDPLPRFKLERGFLPAVSRKAGE
jgi:hypothetical protein